MSFLKDLLNLYLFLTLMFISGCDYLDLNKTPESKRIEGFSSPSSLTYTSKPYFDFSWPEYKPSDPNANVSKSDFKKSNSSVLYHVRIYKNANCSEPAVVETDQHPNSYRYEDLSMESEPITLGVQVKFPNGSLGPLMCSAPVERDVTLPILTLANSTTNPTRENALVLSGSCTDNNTLPASPVYLCTKKNTTCTSADYNVVLSCSNNTYTYTLPTEEGFYDIRAYIKDKAENQSPAQSLGLVVIDKTAPTPVIFTSPTVPSTIGIDQFTFSWVGSDIGLAGLSTTEPFSWTLYSSANCSGAVVGTGTTLNSFVTSSGLINATTYSLLVSAKDDAGNVSTNRCSQPITVASGAPALALQDLTNTLLPQQSLFAKTNTLSVSISSDAAAVGWCLSEAQSTAPTSSVCTGASWVATRPTSFTLSPGDGTKTVYLWIKDSFNNVSALGTNDTITLDTVAPVIAFSNPAALSSHNASVTVSGSCEPGLSVVISGAGAQTTTTTACAAGVFSSTVAFSAGEGSKTLAITQTDSASNSTTVSRNYINDTLAPTITIAAPTALTEAQTTLTLSGACETGLDVSIYGDLATPQTTSCTAGTYSQLITLSAGDGTKTVTAAQTDLAGNSSTVQRQFVKDTVAPALTQTTLASPLYTNTNSVSYGGACESGLTISVSRNGTPESTTTCTTSSWSYTVATQTVDATYNYSFSQIDPAGNTTTVTSQWVRDTVQPTLTLTTAIYTTFTNTVTFSGTCEFGLPANISVSGQDTASTTCDAGGVWSYTVGAQTTNGLRVYTFTYTDRANNTTNIDGAWTRNVVAPVLTLTDSSNTLVPYQNSHAKTTNISASVSNVAGATEWCLSESQNTPPLPSTCLGGAWTAVSPTAHTLSTPDASKTVYLWIKDSLGTVSSLGDSKSIVLDRVAPSIAFTSPAHNSHHNSTVTLVGTCESGLTVVISGTGVSATTNASCVGGVFNQAVTLSASEGSKSVTITQTDNASNSTSLNRTFINDTLPPAIAITGPGILTQVQNTLTLTGTCETGINVSITGDLSAPQVTACAGGAFSQSIILSAGDGVKTITATQTDLAGNSSSASRQFVRDNVAPLITQTTLTSPVYTNTNAVTFGGSCESGYSVAIQRNAAPESSVACMASTWSYTVATQTVDATYNYTFTQTDAAGNSANTTAQWIRDTVAPTLTLPTASYTTFTNTVTFSGACEFGLPVNISITGADTTTTTCNMGGLWTYTVAAQTTNAARSYTFSYTDQANNTTTRVGSWTRNIVAPVLTLTDTTNTNVPQQTTHAKTLGITAHVSAVAGAVGWCLSESQSTAPTPTVCTGSSWVAVSPTAHTLSTPDGSKTVYVWLKDSLNTVSSLGHSRPMTLDRVAPTLAFTAPANNSYHSGTLTLTGTCETGLPVVISGTGVAATTNASCVGSAFSQAITLSAGQGNKSVTITQTDLASNSTSASRTFINDTIAPPLTITSPAANTNVQSSLTLTGACENGLDISITGDILANLTISCSAGTYSQTVFLSAGDGNKTVSVSQTDLANNITTVPRTFVRDNSPPVITQTLQAFPHYTNTNVVTFSGACETGLSISITRNGTPENTTTCTASAWSYAVNTQTVDATYNYSFAQTDAAGNTGTAVARWIRDTVAPTLTFTSSTHFLTASDNVTYTGTCEAGLPTPIAITGSDTSSTPCSAGNWSYTVATQTVDGNRSYSLRLTDQAGNFTNITGTWERNTNVPNLLVTSSTRVVNNLNSATFSGNCEAGLNIQIRLNAVLENTIACPAGTFSYTTAAQVTDNTRNYQFRQTNALMLQTNVVGTWIRDTTAPVFTVGQMNINNNALETNLARVNVDVQATDSLTNITHLCLKLESSQPLANDMCFIAVDSPAIGATPGLSLTLNDYQFNLPIVPDTYSLYAWAIDEAQNVSALTNGGLGTALRDTDSIGYVIYNPPTVDKLVIGSTDFPANPPSTSDLTVGSGQPIYVKWKISDDKAFGATPVSVFFTTDDITYTPVATNIANGQNGACTIDHASTTADDGSTGCYYWASAPVSGFLRLRIVIEDSNGLTAGYSSLPLNVASSMRFLAGNTDPGTNLSAQTALFMTTRQEYLYSPDPQSLVVTRDGTLFFKDLNRGILKVDPSDGVQRIFIPQTGSSTGDNGPVANATVNRVLKITLDHNYPKQRLWIYDNNRIRRVDLETGIITTVIGGGTDNNDTVANPLDARTDWPTSDTDGWKKNLVFFALPNGDFYFQTGNDNYYGPRLNSGYRVRYYEHATGQIKSFKVNSVTSNSQYGAGNFMRCTGRGYGFNYDPVTSNIIDRLINIRADNNWDTGDCETYGNQTLVAALDSNGDSLNVHPPRLFGWHERVTYLTGLDGNLYAYSKYGNNGAWKYNSGSPGSWTKILGNPDNQNGSCDDNTPALSCRTYIHDFFVQENGTIYFLDAGLIRTITPSGNVATLMGQRSINAMSGSPLIARLGTGIREFHLRNDGGITFTSLVDDRIYEFMPDDQMYHIAGTGTAGGTTLGVDSKTAHLSFEHPHNTGDDFALDPATGDIYHSSNSWGIRRLLRDTATIGSSGQWEEFLTGGTYHWADPNADGQSSISFNSQCGTFGYDSINRKDSNCWIYPQLKAFANNTLFMHKNELSFTSGGSQRSRNNMIKLYDATSKVQTHLVGTLGEPANHYDANCADGVLLSSCDFYSAAHYRIVSPSYDSVDNKWMTLRTTGNRVFVMVPGGSMASWVLDQAALSFAYRRNGGDEYIYYCASSNKQIRRRHINTGTEVALSWPVPSVACTDGAMKWSNTRGSVIFVYTQNKLTGFAEYLDPNP